MTPQEQLGKRLFLILATLMVFGNLIVWCSDWGGVGGYSARIPVCLALSIPFLWLGHAWLIRLVGGACVLSGGLALFVCVPDLADLSTPIPVMTGILGLGDILAGLAFLFLPSLRAFFRYQRGGASHRPLSPEEATSPKASHPTWRVAATRGLIAAGACVVTLAVVSAIWGGLFGWHPGATIFGTADPGLEGAVTMATFCVIFGGLPAALVGFVVGFVWSLW
jgi:hypothetical protein